MTFTEVFYVTTNIYPGFQISVLPIKHLTLYFACYLIKSKPKKIPVKTYQAD